MPEPTAAPRTVVTGGAGFIGSNVVDALLDDGHAVTVLDDLSTGRRENLDPALERGATLVEVDVRDAPALDAAVAAARPELIFHLAAQIDVRRSVEDPAHDATVNVVGTVNLLESARRHGVRRVINTSTGGAIYGTADVVPTPESAPERPLAAYGTSKLCAEQYCAWYARLHGLSTATLRLANVYGPRQDPLGEAGVIAIFCDRLLAGEAPTIYGDGLQTRDFVFVGDVVRAQLRAAASSLTGTVNVGTGRATSVLELVDAVAAAGEAAGIDARFAPTAFDAPRAGEVVDSCLDVRHAADALGFTTATDLVDGLRRTLEWVGERRAGRA
ncbi:NAD-dependent epimerase/dehydratase family protein [Patulibacter defluvii]|uniref:NAD-dependent epimerase/dehydratase family protein n=1 Tax=Patulibacter defluvii TaxID=3095358 RepID=UPI002A753318|nr:NAD-dependent epimerase/dehydratase family protein [Patulibacter sp. DM4]